MLEWYIVTSMVNSVSCGKITTKFIDFYYGSTQFHSAVRNREVIVFNISLPWFLGLGITFFGKQVTYLTSITSIEI